MSSERVQRLERKVELVRRVREPLLVGAPLIAGALWWFAMPRMSWGYRYSDIDQALVAVVVIVFAIVAIAHSFYSAVVEQRLEDARREDRIPRARARKRRTLD